MIRTLVIAVAAVLLSASSGLAAGPDQPDAPGYSRMVLKAAFSCDGRHLCRQMRSCAEARFFLEVCGVSRLDGDGDGVPCESICGSN
jgi:hypothetical protein